MSVLYRCKLSGLKDITVGKTYSAYRLSERHLAITNDSGEKCIYHESLFEMVPGKPPIDSAQKDMKYDQGKPRMDLLLDGCPNALEAVASILTFGAQKYAAHSWQSVDNGDARYKAALLRHLTAHAKGEVNDPESGMPHLAHAACNAMFILELELRKAVK